MNVLFVKQRVYSYGVIERGLERAAAEIPGLRLATADLSQHLFSQPSPLREQPRATRMKRAVADLLQEVLRDRSEYVLLLNGFVLRSYCNEFFAALKAAGRTLISWQIDDPYYLDKTAKFVDHLDFVFTVDSSTLPLYRGRGKKIAYLPLACDPAVHRSQGALPEKYRCDVCFIGAPFAGSRRVRLIDELAPFLARQRTRIMGATEIDTWRGNLARFADLEGCIVDERVRVSETMKYFSAARINLNIHKDSYGHVWDRNSARIQARSPAERTFAIAGCGGFQLIDDTRPDLAELFEPGRELVTFADAADLAHKIEYYLRHEDERRAIALAGQARAYGAHTYAHRLKALLASLH